MLKKKLRNIILIAFVYGVILLPTKAHAFQITDNQTVDSNRVWTVNFTSEVGADTLSKSGITVIDSKGNVSNVIVYLGFDGKSIIVTAPKEGYTPGEKYTLLVDTRVHSKSGKSLKQTRSIRFNIRSK